MYFSKNTFPPLFIVCSRVLFTVQMWKTLDFCMKNLYNIRVSEKKATQLSKAVAIFRKVLNKIVPNTK